MFAQRVRPIAARVAVITDRATATAKKRLQIPLDLVWLAGWRDLMLAAGFVCFVQGIRLYSVALAWIAAGLGLMALSFMMSSAPKPPQPPRAH